MLPRPLLPLTLLIWMLPTGVTVAAVPPQTLEPVDHAVGVVCLAKHGDRVARGEPLAEIHARDGAAAEAAEAALLAAYEIGGEPAPRQLVLDVIR